MSSPVAGPAPAQRPFAVPAGPWVGFLAVLVLFTLLIGIKGELGTFLSLGNLRVLLHEGTVPAIVGLGMLLVLITGGIDLSVGAVVALVTVVTMRVYTGLYGSWGPGPATGFFAATSGVLIGGLCGLTNGLLVTRLNLPTELLRAVYGLDPVRSGVVKVQTFVTPAATPAERIEQGFGMLSEDRKAEGLALEMSVADNVTLSKLGGRGWFGFLSRRRLGQAVSGVLARLGVKCRDPGQPVGELSGGNQQKVALARLFHQEADILLLDEPTKGVDVGSKAEIYRQIGAAAAAGKAVLVVSSYLPELFGVCDTLAVMCRGRLTAPRPVSGWTAEAVIAAATGT